jgi:hypothetical protein
VSTETLYDDLVGNSTNVNLFVVNVVATANVNQPDDLPRLNGTSWGPYDARIYRSGYARDRDIIGKVIVFNSVKLISVGTKSSKQASAELKHAVKLLASASLVEQVPLGFEIVQSVRWQVVVEVSGPLPHRPEEPLYHVPAAERGVEPPHPHPVQRPCKLPSARYPWRTENHPSKTR